MQGERNTMTRGVPRAVLLTIASLSFAVFMTWPLAAGLGSLGRTGVTNDPRFGTNGDGMFCLWNVSWVAHAVIADPLNLFDANIFHPHKNSLAYSEANIVAGVIGVPVWWLTKNPYTTLNVVILFAFATAWLCTWLLVYYLTQSVAAATVAGILYAFCPYVFAHTAHIQLLLTGGIPLSMLMLHRLADRPSVRRGVALGAALLVQALACAYYGIFAGLIVGFAVIFLTISRSLFKSATWWTAVGVAAAVAIAGVAPFFAPYAAIQHDQGFSRTLEESVKFSANVRSYLASSAYAHRPVLNWLVATGRGWNEIMFPGFLGIALAVIGVVTVARPPQRSIGTRDRETVLLYGSIGVLAFWASFGPPGGLYSVLYNIPMFSFLRAPSRMAIVVVLSLVVIGGLGARRLVAAAGARHAIVGGLLALLAVADLATPMPWERALSLPEGYGVLTRMPPGPVAEFPFYGGREAWHLHTQYMTFSTAHWMPMMNGYSDYTPPQFRRDSFILDSFPSNDSFAVLEKARVRYIGIHWDMFGPRAEEIRQRLEPFKPYLRPIDESPRVSFYEIIGFP
jgi:hypothetical protein